MGQYILKLPDIIVYAAVNDSILCRNGMTQMKTKYSSMTYHQKQLYTLSIGCAKYHTYLAVHRPETFMLSMVRN